MPFVRIETSKALAPAIASALAAHVSPVVARILGKPERYVMVVVTGATAMRMSGADGPAAFVDVRSIGGLGDGPNRALCRELSAALRDLAGIEPERVYLGFADVAAGDWGHGDDTFG